MKSYVLDACALIALFQEEEGANVVENLLVEAKEGICTVFMHRLNLMEVYYGYLRDFGSEIAQKHIDAVESSCIKIIDTISKEIMYEASKIKSIHKMSLADSIAVAQGVIKRAILVTSDHHELDAVDKDGLVEILWIR